MSADQNVDDEGTDSTHGATAVPPERAVDRDSIRREIERQFELVPEIGTRWRWYDIPYRLLSWSLSGPRRRFVPWRVQTRLVNGMNFLVTFDHYERLKIEQRTDPYHNLIVPTDEKITQGALWVVELFPPSYSADLLRSLKKNGWDDSKIIRMEGDSNAEQVSRARRGRGFLWSRLGAVANPKSRYFATDAKREVLPPDFDLIELTAIQIGTSMTAVVAFVLLSKSGQTALNNVWKADHEPAFEWRGLQRPHVEGRLFSAIHSTQRERQRIHDAARAWLTDRCGGFFSQTEAGQPVVDFNMFEKFDPTSSDPRTMSDPLRALSMQGNYVYNYASPQIPGAVLIPAERSGATAPEAPRNCWGVVGQYQVFADVNDKPGYGSKPYSVTTLAAMIDNQVRAFSLYNAVQHYVRELGEQAATQRDAARSKHQHFSPRQLDALKRDLLANSLDLPAVARDTEQLWTPRWQRWQGIEVWGVPAPGAYEPPDKFDMIKELGESRTELFDALIADDAAYRAVLATTSSLGASAASARLGRRALAVSATSLLVSATTLIVVNGPRVWSWIASWLAS